MRTLQRLLCAALLALAAAMAVVAPGALAVGEGEVVVVLKDGRKLTGTILSETAEKVVLKMRLATVELIPGEIQEIQREGGSGAGPSGSPPGPGSPPDPGGTGGPEGEGDPAPGPRFDTIAVVTLRDGTVIRGRSTDCGSHIEVANELGTIRIDKKSILTTRTEQVPRAPAAAAGTAAERPEVRDYGLGFAVTRPSPAWRFVDPSPDPLARVVMRRRDPDVELAVMLLPALEPNFRDVDPQNLDRVRAETEKELKERFRAVRGFQMAIERHRRVPVYRLAYQAETRYFGRKTACREVRFHRGDASFALVATAPLDREKEVESPADLAAELEAALASFSFLGGAEADEARYASRTLGFQVERPRADWRIVARLLDPRVPVEVLSPDGTGRYTVEAAPAGTHGSAGAAADALERTLGERSRFFKRIGREDRDLGSGVTSVDLRYQDFGEGTRLLEVRRLMLVHRDGRLVELVAAHAATDIASPDRAAAVGDLFASFAPLIEEAPAAVERRAARATAFRTAGERKMEEKQWAAAIDELDQALALAPKYGLALLLRGRAYAETGDFRRALADYEAGSDVLEDPEIGRLVAAAQAKEAEALGKGGDLPAAVKLLEKAVKNDPSSKAHREALVRALVDLGRGLADEGKYEAAIAKLKDAVRDWPDEARLKQQLLRAHHDYAQKLMADDADLYKARSVVKRALAIDPENSRSQQLLERIEERIKKKEQPDKK